MRPTPVYKPPQEQPKLLYINAKQNSTAPEAHAPRTNAPPELPAPPRSHKRKAKKQKAGLPPPNITQEEEEKVFTIVPVP